MADELALLLKIRVLIWAADHNLRRMGNAIVEFITYSRSLWMTLDVSSPDYGRSHGSGDLLVGAGLVRQI
jgi:hypothetical protein